MTIVYRYGIAAPHGGADVVLDQMRRAHAYERDLVLIERARRDAERELRRGSSEALRQCETNAAAAEARCETLGAEIRAARKSARKRVETEVQRAELLLARAHAKARRQALIALRQSLLAQCADCRKANGEEIPCPHASPEAVELRSKLDVLDDRAKDLRNGARGLSGLYWGTYLLVEKACRASFTAPLYERDGITPHDPRLAPWRWAGEGAVAVQIQSTRPLDVAGLLAGEDARARLSAPAWPEDWLAQQSRVEPGRASAPPRGFMPDGVTPASPTRPDGTPARWVRDRAARHGELGLRVGKDGETAAWRLDYHRPLPAGASISWVTVHRRMRGPHPEWSACITVETTTATAPASRLDDLDRPTIAVDIGWRQMPDGSLRVAGWADTAGGRGEFVLSPADIRALRQCEDLQSERDVLYEAVRDRLKRWIDDTSEATEWMRAISPTIRAWRSPARLVSLLARWRAEEPNVTPGAVVIRADLEAWADRDRHAWATVEARRIWALRRRKDKYQCWAKEIAKLCGTVVLEKFDLRSMAVRKPVGEDAAENETARSNRQLAAVSYLREYLLQASRAQGATVVQVDAADSTRTCPSCGLVADRDAQAQVRLACECGHAWDQDVEGAAPVLLARYRERPGDAKILVGARSGGSSTEQRQKGADRWARARRMGAAKKERIRGARETAGNGAE